MMKIRILLILPLCTAIFFPAILLYAQMPDWKFFRDREGNGYYYDRAMKIRITDEKSFDYTPATVNGIDYYFNKGADLVKAGRYTEGLFYFKSLKTLPMDNLRVERNAKDAAKWINFLQKKHGIRYEKFDHDSTILINLYNGKYSIINEKNRYKIIINKLPHVIRAVWKLNDKGYGLKFGFNLEKQISENKSPASGEDDFQIEAKVEDKGYDCVVGIETRILKGKIANLGEAEESWRNEFGKDNFKREEILRKDDRVIYQYTYSDGVPFSGIEGIFINGNIIHIVRVLCSNSIKDKVFEEIRKPVEEMVLVR